MQESQLLFSAITVYTEMIKVINIHAATSLALAPRVPNMQIDTTTFFIGTNAWSFRSVCPECDHIAAGHRLTLPDVF
jgi:hypothetical protein